jgi:hypothetical protein
MASLSGGDREHAIFRKKDVAVEASPFVPGANQIDDSVELDDLSIRQRCFHEHDIVQLEKLPVFDRNPKLEGHRIQRSEYTTHGGAHAAS